MGNRIDSRRIFPWKSDPECRQILTPNHIADYFPFCPSGSYSHEKGYFKNIKKKQTCGQAVGIFGTRLNMKLLALTKML